MTTTVDRPTAPRLRLALAMLALGQLIFSLDLNIVFVALPEIGADLGFPGQTQQWVVSAYTVATGGFLLFGGRLSDLIGRRRVLLTALALYGTASLAGGLAASPGLIVAARTVQGLGGALLLPSTLAIINNLFAQGRERNRALAVWGGFGASGLTVGALLGGILTDGFGWPAVFFVNVPLAAIVIFGVLASVPRDQPATTGRRFDLPGAITATIGATAIVFALVEGPELGWAAVEVIVAGLVGVVSLASFFRIEARSTDPLLPIALLRHRSLATSAAVTFVFMGTFGVLPYFLTTVLFGGKYGCSALGTGLAFLVPSVAIFLGTQLGERYTTKHGARAALTVGFALGVVGTVALAFAFIADAGLAAAFPGLIASGLGQGIVWTAMFAAVGSGVDPSQAGVANAVATTTLNVGNAVGLGAIIAAASIATTAEHGGFLAVLITAAGMGLGLLIALTLPRRAAT